jgi:hypothetical protein
VVVGLALWFAVQGGEFSPADLFRQRQRRARLAKQADSLQHQVDSLRKYENCESEVVEAGILVILT